MNDYVDLNGSYLLISAILLCISIGLAFVSVHYRKEYEYIKNKYSVKESKYDTPLGEEML